MIVKIDLRDISRKDRFAPSEGYAERKAQSLLCIRPDAYKIQDHMLHVDTSRAGSTPNHIKEMLNWGYQMNSKEY